MFKSIIGPVLLMLVLSGCGNESGSPAAPMGDASAPTVTIEDLAFTPETLAVEAGDTVSWTWNDGSVTHDVVGNDFRSEIMSEGTFSHRFDSAGTYEYGCSVHPTMAGTIEVTT